MRVLRQVENSGAGSRQTSHLRLLIEDLKRGVVLLEADIDAVEAFERQVNSTNFASPIAARTRKSRRDNLLGTMILERRPNAVPNNQVELTSLKPSEPTAGS